MRVAKALHNPTSGAIAGYQVTNCTLVNKLYIVPPLPILFLLSQTHKLQIFRIRFCILVVTTPPPPPTPTQAPHFSSTPTPILFRSPHFLANTSFHDTSNLLEIKLNFLFHLSLFLSLSNSLSVSLSLSSLLSYYLTVDVSVISSTVATADM